MTAPVGAGLRRALCPWSTPVVLMEGAPAAGW